MKEVAVLSQLRELEALLLRSDVRSDPQRLGALLHPDFVEIGASGETYTRAEILTEFQGKPPTYTVWAQDFSVTDVVPGIALSTFRTAHIEADGRLSRHVARSSIWQHAGQQWLIRFHQGTPTAPFEKHAI